MLYLTSFDPCPLPLVWLEAPLTWLALPVLTPSAYLTVQFLVPIHLELSNSDPLVPTNLVTFWVLHPSPLPRLIYLRVYDNRAISSKTTPSPSSLWHSLTHPHRSIGYRNIPQPLVESVARLIYLRVYDNRARSQVLRQHPPRRPYNTRSHIHTGLLVIGTSPRLWLKPSRD